jgi:hypothetical protein
MSRSTLKGATHAPAKQSSLAQQNASQMELVGQGKLIFDETPKAFSGIV